MPHPLRDALDGDGLANDFGIGNRWANRRAGSPRVCGKGQTIVIFALTQPKLTALSRLTSDGVDHQAVVIQGQDGLREFSMSVVVEVRLQRVTIAATPKAGPVWRCRPAGISCLQPTKG